MSICARANVGSWMVADPNRARAVRVAGAWVGVGAAVAGGALVLDGYGLAGGGEASLAACGVVFACVAVGCVGATRTRPVAGLVKLGAFGALFPVWGTVMGLLLYVLGGLYGVPQSVVTAWVLWEVTGSVAVGLSSIGGVMLAWAVVLSLDVRSVHVAPLVVLTGVWNAFVAGAMLYWVARRARVGPRWRGGGVCRECGYDLTGNVSGRCPECGERRGEVWA